MTPWLLCAVWVVLPSAFAGQASDELAQYAAMTPADIRVSRPEGVPVLQAQYTPPQDGEFRRQLAGAGFSGNEIDWLVHVRNLMHKDYYRPVDDALLLRGAVAGDPESGERNRLYNALKGMVRALRERYGDKHSWFRNPEQYEAYKRDGMGVRTSFGFVTAPKVVGAPFVVAGVFNTGPAQRAGIAAGDEILAIDGALTAGMSRPPAAASAQLSLQVRRARSTTVFNAVLTEAELTMPDVSSHIFPEQEVGYVYVQHFNEKTEDGDDGRPGNFSYQIQGLAQALSAHGRRLRGLIVDLRGNPGGVGVVCTRMAGIFLKHDDTIIILKSGKGTVVRKKQGNGAYPPGSLPLAVLVDKNSASCSEVFAGAIQDHRRGHILGSSCTYGKGVGQTVRDLPQGMGLALTADEWFTPSGRSVQGVGVCPDQGLTVSVPDDQRKAISSSVEAQVYGTSAALAEDPLVDRALRVLGQYPR